MHLDEGVGVPHPTGTESIGAPERERTDSWRPQIRPRRPGSWREGAPERRSRPRTERFNLQATCPIIEVRTAGVRQGVAIAVEPPRRAVRCPTNGCRSARTRGSDGERGQRSIRPPRLLVRHVPPLVAVGHHLAQADFGDVVDGGNAQAGHLGRLAERRHSAVQLGNAAARALPQQARPVKRVAHDAASAVVVWLSAIAVRSSPAFNAFAAGHDDIDGKYSRPRTASLAARALDLVDRAGKPIRQIAAARVLRRSHRTRCGRQMAE